MKRIFPYLVFVLMVFFGSCTRVYIDDKKEGSVIFWYDDKVAEALIKANIKNVDFYFGGKLIGSQTAGRHYSRRPDCGATGTMSITVEVGVYQYSVECDGIVFWKGNFEVLEDICNAMKLIL